MILQLWLTLISTTLIKGELYSNNTLEYRMRRQVNGLPLVFPYGGVYKFVLGMGIPIKMRDEISLGFAISFQYQYQQFQNISELSRYYFIKEVSREQRDQDCEHRKDERLVFYKAVVNLLETNGMNGYDCVLRAICEAAQYPVEEEGLVGELFHILLTPDYGRSALDKDPEWERSMEMFQDAAMAGRQMFNCPSIYSGCPQGQGLLDLVTILRDE